MLPRTIIYLCAKKLRYNGLAFAVGHSAGTGDAGLAGGALFVCDYCAHGPGMRVKDNQRLTVIRVWDIYSKGNRLQRMVCGSLCLCTDASQP